MTAHRPPRVAPAVIDPVAHLVWARAIARGVRADFRFVRGSQEELELEATAYLALCECAHRFQLAKVPAGGCADGAFRGWCAIEVRSRCRREALRLRGGGTFHTTRTAAGRAVRVEALPTARDGGEEARDVAVGADCRRPVFDDEPEPWSPCVTDD